MPQKGDRRMYATNSALLTRLELIEKEIAELKKKLLQEVSGPRVTLKGIWKGMEITEQDFEDAKRSLFREIDDI